MQAGEGSVDGGVVVRAVWVPRWWRETALKERQAPEQEVGKCESLRGGSS